ncbi:hypothetical protein GCM10028864_10470 [Microlunatus parietis]|uniref:hypothetical protein n=1 Tax=Microlunatus parietis TaxID=682979 RepID=UPI0015CBA93B|nr:hypothetical protein [Microlunatus parietis]
MIVLSCLALVAVAAFGVLAFRNVGETASSVTAPPNPPRATNTSEHPKKKYTKVPDTGGPATGQAEAFSTLLRARGLVCSDEKLAKVFSRGCYRQDPEHLIRVEFLGPVDGRLSKVEIHLDYLLADDRDDAPGAFDDLVGDFVEAAELSAADAAAVRRELAGKQAEFNIDWGEVKLQRPTVSTSTIRLLRAGWKPPELFAAKLPGDLDLVESVAVQRGFRCERNEYEMECTQGGDGLTIRASPARPEGIDRLYVHARTDDDTAMDAALAEIGAVLDALGGPRAAAAKDWYFRNRTAAGGLAYVDGLLASLVVVDDHVHTARFELTSPCRANSDNGGFC